MNIINLKHGSLIAFVAHVVLGRPDPRDHLMRSRGIVHHEAGGLAKGEEHSEMAHEYTTKAHEPSIHAVAGSHK